MVNLEISKADESQAGLILSFIKKLADYEKLSHEVCADEATLRDSLFGPKPLAEAVLAHLDGHPAGFAVFFHNFSTFTGRCGIYLEDLFVEPEHRGLGVGKALLVYLARLAKDRNCSRLNWSVLDWNEPSIQFYNKLGAVAKSEWTVFRLDGDALDALADTPL